MTNIDKYYIGMGTAAVLYNDSIYFSGIQISGLYKMNIETGEVEFLCKFEKEKNEYQLHYRAYLYKSEIWFIPYFAKYIACVNVNTLDIEYFNLPDFKENKYGKELYGTTYYDSGRFGTEMVYLVPTGNYTPIILDMKNKVISPYPEIPEVKNQIIGFGSVYHNELWMSPVKGEFVYSLNLNTGKLYSKRILFNDGEFSGICIYQNKLWFAPYKSDKLRCYSLDNDSFIDYSIGEFYNKKYSYRSIINVEDDLWILPWESPYIICFNVESNTFSKMFCDLNNENALHYMMEIGCDENRMIFSEGGYGKIDIWYKNKKTFQIKECWMESQKFILHLKKIFGDNYITKYSEQIGGILMEKDFGLNHFVGILTNH